MILKLNIDKNTEDMLLAEYKEPKPPTIDITKTEKALQAAISILKDQSESYHLKRDRNAVTKRPITITSAM